MAYKNLNLSATECRNCGPAPDYKMNDMKDLIHSCNKISSVQTSIFIFKGLAPRTAFGVWRSLPMGRNCVSLTACLPDFFQFDEELCCLNHP